MLRPNRLRGDPAPAPGIPCRRHLGWGGYIRKVASRRGERPRLRTHKLKGKLSGSWAASVTHDLRLVFELVDHEGERAILLTSVEMHDEVY